MHNHYTEVIEKTQRAFPDSRPLAPNLPFAQCTLNVGEKSTSGEHVDGKNFASGLCTVAPVGRFDYSRGGHLIMHELRIILEVPAGSIVFFPSAIITHENTPVQQGETRQVVTAYASGSVFQSADSNFVPQGKGRPEAEKIAHGKSVWRDGIQRFPNANSWFSPSTT
jgi:hypothetical protein